MRETSTAAAGPGGSAAAPPPRRVFFDAYELAPGAGRSIGIYNYARHLLQALARSGARDTELIVACNGAARADFAPPPGARLPIRLLQVAPAAPRLSQRLRWIFGGAAAAMRRTRADTYFSPRGFLPYGLRRARPRVTTVVTVHDLIRLWYHEHFPSYFPWLEDRFVCRELLRSAREADRVITISHASAIDIARRARRSTGVHVVYNGVAAGPAPARPRRALGYLFAITSPLPHKNRDGLLAAYAAYRARVSAPLPLVVCGIDDPGQPGVRAVKGLSDAQLAAAYDGANAFLFLSLAEGFGFPPLEAASRGVPTLCSDLPVLREVLGDGAHYVDPRDPLRVADGLAALLRQGDAATPVARLRERFDWACCAERTLELLR